MGRRNTMKKFIPIGNMVKKEKLEYLEGNL